MHELAICESILRILKKQARMQNFTRIERVCLEIGPFSGVEIKALKFGFDVAKRNSLAEAATLDIVETPAEAWCMSCARSVPVKERFDPCPDCGSHQLQITRGEELRIKELEVN